MRSSPARLTETLSFLNLQLTPEGFHELDGKQRAVSVRLEDIRGVELADGFTGERLLLQWVFGVAVLSVGVYVAAPALSGPAGEVNFSIMMPLFLLTLAGVVAWNSLRRGPHVRVRTGMGVRKLIVRGPHERADAEAFLARVRAALGLT